jgi:tellurite resistance protein
MRDRVHDGVKTRWLAPREPGERRIMQEVRVLGVLYADEILVEIEDGTLIKRFVEGPNKGTVFVETFESKGPSKTLAQIRAVVPLTGFKWAVGALFKLAVKKALEKALVEHKRDIEGGYTPGRARGNVDAALEFMRPVAERAKSLERDADRIALIAPLIEAACVTAIADDELDDAERDAIRTVTHAIGVRPLDDAAIEAVVASSIDHTRRQGVEQRCNELGMKLKKLGLAEEGLGVAILIAQVSHGVDQSELAALQLLARAAGVPEARLVDVIQRIDQTLSR